MTKRFFLVLQTLIFATIHHRILDCDALVVFRKKFDNGIAFLSSSSPLKMHAWRPLPHHFDDDPKYHEDDHDGSSSRSSPPSKGAQDFEGKSGHHGLDHGGLSSSSARTSPERPQLQSPSKARMDRRNILVSGASIASSVLIPSISSSNNHLDTSWIASAEPAPLLATSSTTTNDSTHMLIPRSVYNVQSHGSIPVWPSWGGGRVIPINFMGGGDTETEVQSAILHDPFLLLAHHDHWFDPNDPLRKPFQKFGQITGLPYIDVEGFSLHPHRGFDIWTYILDGSDGFLHRDSLGETTKLYQGGTTQFMRTGSGVLHEEFWETSNDRRTNIELFQLWVNLPSSHKMDEPAIHYIGKNTQQPWIETDIINNIDGEMIGSVRSLSDTLSQSINDTKTRTRPPVQIYHVKLNASTDGSSQNGHHWTFPIPPSHSALLYVRKGSINLPHYIGSNSIAAANVQVKAQQTATWTKYSGDCITLQQSSKDAFDGLLLTAEPLHESVVTAGPIVMNTQREIRQAYEQLSDGTFLDRDYALRQHYNNRGGSEAPRSIA